MTLDTHEKILQAAFSVLSRQGYENTSTKDIAEEAGVAQGLIHYYFKSKQQLVLAVLAFVCKKVELGVEGEAGALAAFEETKTMLRTSRDTNSLLIQLIGVSLTDPVKINHYQHVAMTQSRLHIPILFAYDTIHGYRTIFPVPLGAASSFDPRVATADDTVAARETATVGMR